MTSVMVVIGISAVVLGATSVLEALAVLIALTALFALLRRRRPCLDSLETVALAERHVEAGSFEVAVELLEPVSRRHGSIGDMARICLAVAHLRMANHRRAATLLSDMLRLHPSGTDGSSADAQAMLAYCLAACGDLEGAKRLYLSVPGIQAAHGPLRTLLCCRRGEFAEAAASRPPLRAESGPGLRRVGRADCDLGDHGQRVVALLTALAVTRTKSSRGPQLVARLLPAARPAFAGEYAYLQADWPELQRFLKDHEVTLRPAPSAPPPWDLPLARAVRYTP